MHWYNEIWNALVEALRLIVTLDPEVVDITRRSLIISVASCLICFLISLPLGSLIHFSRFPGKSLLISIIQTLYSMPTVAVGLIVWLTFSSSGPLGTFSLMFTPMLMIIGQVVLITPVMLGLVISALNAIDKAVPETATALGASRFQASLATIREARFGVMTAVVMGFGRAIAEVGVSQMLGGNIALYTRTLTTAMMRETYIGNRNLAMALGIILIAVALVVNIVLNRLQQRRR